MRGVLHGQIPCGKIEMRSMKFIKILVCISAVVLLASCGEDTTIQIDDLITESVSESETDVIEIAGADIVLSQDKADISGAGASFEDGILKIARGGVYTLSGNLEGSVVVSASKSDVVELVLNGVEISSKDSAAIYVECVDKIVITLSDGSENRLSDGVDYAKEDGSEPSACLYSADDMTIAGSGSLIVEANSRNGIQTKNDLRIKGGEITVSAAKNALKGKDSVEITGGIIKVLASTDGIKSDNEEEEGRGIVEICGAEISLVCQDDGIQAFRSVNVSDCKIEIAAGDKQINCDGEIFAEEGCIATLTE